MKDEKKIMLWISVTFTKGITRLKCFWNTPQFFNLFLSFRAYCHYFAIVFKVIDILPADKYGDYRVSQDEHVQAYHVFTIQIIQSDITMLDF